MLDGLLGKSGFYSKCKSLIKQTRTRIEVVRRKRNATQKFLRKDIADLLANGLEKNALGRADGLISELILSSCYDFIDHVCELILKHLPVLQKLRQCPEDCREAVGSLIFAAARLSELPELRELRDLFQERYGSSLEYYVNQKLVENITPRPPSMEKNIQLLEEIASEFSLRWDSRGFEERMAKASVSEQKHQRSPETLYAAQSNISTPLAKDTVQRTVKAEVLPKKRSEATYQSRERQVDSRHQTETSRDGNFDRKDELRYNVAPELTKNRYKPPSVKEESHQKKEDYNNNFQRRIQKTDRYVSEENNAEEVIQVGNTSHGKRSESLDKLGRHRQDDELEIDLLKILSQQKPDPRPANNGLRSPSSVHNYPAENIHVRSMSKKQEDVTDGLKSNFRGGVPPPYLKPRKSKHKVDVEENDTLTFIPAGNSNRLGNPPTKPDLPDAHENVDGVERVTEIYYKDESGVESTPRRRSHRRRHSRSASSQDAKVNGEVGNEERVVRRVSTSRRRHESKKGLQILFDDDHEQKDDEEKMIDKLLLHYSKKPSSSDPGKPRKETKNRKNDAINSPLHKAAVSTSMDEEDSTPRKETSRSMSFPSRPVTQPEPQKVFARAASFQQEAPAKHVHPKLPDYDDLAARFAALRSSKD